ncbi:tetratricopeptide repeat protein [Patescibacteria group bacterium]
MDSLQNLTDRAAQAALKKNWSKAIKINLLILAADNKDIASLNRLAWAYFQIGQRHQALETYQKVLEIDETNPISLKNIQRLNSFSDQSPPLLTTSPIDISSFLEEPGKTQVVPLAKITGKTVMQSLCCGQSIKIIPKSRTILIHDHQDRYLGIIPDDLSVRLIRLINLGNEYQGWLKKVEFKVIQVFLKEVYRCPQLQNTPSF